LSFEKNRDQPFTFLRYDGVPWKNNAEHAIKAFARLRDVISGSSTKKGVDEYLTLLSVSETCKNRGIDFLDFLRSGERSIMVFERRAVEEQDQARRVGISTSNALSRET